MISAGLESQAEARSARRAVLGAVLIGLLRASVGLAADAAAPAPPAPPSLTLAPCDVPGLPGKARCGTYQVWENRETRSGRRIPLKVVVVPATGPDRAPDPFTFFHGGPGAAATEVAPFLAHDYAKILERRDILLVDQRGTGGSHSLNCEMYLPPGDLQATLGPFFPLEAVRKCRAT